MSAIAVGNDTCNDRGRMEPSRAAARVPCAWCGVPFLPRGRGRYHSGACRVAAHRARRALTRVPERAPRASSVYECAGCGLRALGEQRCPECNRFRRALGPGGECPCCAEPVAVADLLGTEG